MYFVRNLNFILYFSLLTSFAQAVDLCPRFRITNDEVKLKEAEIGLICGNSQNEAWNDIPDNQAIFHVRNFLQARGYFHPVITLKDKRIEIDPGPTTEVTKLTVRYAPDDLDVTRLRHIRGEILTPDLLSSMEKRIIEQLGFLGFACPRLQMEANYDTGEIFVNVNAGRPGTLTDIIHRENYDFNTEVLRRYEATPVPAHYDARLLRLTEQRILAQGIVQSTFYDSKCEEKGVVAYNKSIAGPPRTIGFGVGIETEKLLTAQATWKDARMGQRASSVEVKAFASLRDQGLSVDSSWYAISSASRFHLKPFFLFKHENYQNYEHLNSIIGLSAATSYDNQVFGLKGRFGPTINLNRTIRGEGPSFSKFLSFKGEVTLSEHTYELYQATPRSGWEIALQGNFTNNKVLSNVSAQMLRLSIDKLWNIANYDPPLIVLGLRAHLATTLTPETIQSKELPTDFRHFLGGSSDLRGFSLKELPNNRGGALTAVDAQFEARANILPWGLQPFAFVDVGMMGSESASLSRAIYWSPGVGMRWQLPFGVIRTTFAHGFATDRSEIEGKNLHNQFFFSFGEEF